LIALLLSFQFWKKIHKLATLAADGGCYLVLAALLPYLGCGFLYVEHTKGRVKLVIFCFIDLTCGADNH